MSHMVFGPHALLSALNSPVTRVIEIFALSGSSAASKSQAVLAEAKEKKVPVRLVDRAHLDKLSGEQNHQGVVAMTQRTRAWEEGDLLDLIQAQPNTLVLVLDGVQDPHNLGACLRSADAFGVKAVIIPKDKSCQMTPVVEKVACGAAETVPVIPVTNLARTLRDLKDNDYWIVGLDGDSEETLDQVNTSGNVAVVMGGEGSGLRRLTKEHCDFLVKIPMVGTVGSLNVSVAAGVALYAVFSTKMAAGKTN